MIKRMFRTGAVLLLLSNVVTHSQAQKKYELTIKQAVDLAYQNLTEVKNAALDVEIQRAQNREITGQALPQITGAAGLSRYLELPQIIFPDASQAAIYSVLIKEGLLPSGTKIPVPTSQAITFVQPWNTNVGATLSQLLFQPDVFVGLQARKTALGVAQSNLELTRERVKDSAYRRYYAILIAQKQAEFLAGGIKRLEKLYHDDSVMYVNGFAEKLDLDKVQVQLTNLRSSFTVLDNSIKVAYAALRFSIGLSQKDTVILRESLTSDQIKNNVLADNFQYEDRKEIQTLNYVKNLQELDVKRNKLGFLPTFSTFVNYTVQGQGKKFITDDNTLWFRSSQIGLNLSLPIFDGFQRKYKIQQAQLSLKKAENNVANMKQVIDLQQEISKETLKNALVTLDAQERNVQLAESVYNTTKKKFESGLGSSFEVLLADNDWQTAQSNYFTSLYNAIVAKISYQSSLGKLD